MNYLLTYRIDFSDMLVDEADYFRYMNMIQAFANTALRNYLLATEPSILPAFDETSENQVYIIKARFKNTGDLHSALNLLYNFCMLNYLIDDPNARIELVFDANA